MKEMLQEMAEIASMHKQSMKKVYMKYAGMKLQLMDVGAIKDQVYRPKTENEFMSDIVYKLSEAMANLEFGMEDQADVMQAANDTLGFLSTQEASE